MFIALTERHGEMVRINFARVDFYMRPQNRNYTEICFARSHYLTVQETPEQIDAMVSRQQEPSVEPKEEVL